VTLEMRIDIEPGATVARHTHPGIESSYLIEGGVELSVDGEGTRSLAPGDGFQIPPGLPHSGKMGRRRLSSSEQYVVEKRKPLASPA
jgi:quercetin dioxygenase-like cupin family protein